MTMTPSPTSPMIILGDWYLMNNVEGPATGSTWSGNGDAYFTYDVYPNMMVTFNPNNNVGIYPSRRFNTKNSAGVDYFSLFESVQNNGATVSLSQSGNTATFILVPNGIYLNDFGSYRSFTISFPNVEQTQNSPNPFVLGQPITITLRG
jgi:hypothetical protein